MEQCASVDAVARTFLSAGYEDFPVPSSCRPSGSRNWKAPRTRRLESWRYASLGLASLSIGRVRATGAGRRSSADILVCGFWGLSRPQFVLAEKIAELESSANPLAGKPALRRFDAALVWRLRASEARWLRRWSGLSFRGTTPQANPGPKLVSDKKCSVYAVTRVQLLRTRGIFAVTRA